MTIQEMQWGELKVLGLKYITDINKESIEKDILKSSIRIYTRLGALINV